MSESTESVSMSVSMILQPTPMRTHCEACGGPVYANVFHTCGEMQSRSFAPYDTNSLGFPPQVTASQSRTHCEACGEPLYPDRMHKCAGNEEWKPR
jgi:RNase P subunit RPR2